MQKKHLFTNNVLAAATLVTIINISNYAQAAYFRKHNRDGQITPPFVIELQITVM